MSTNIKVYFTNDDQYAVADGNLDDWWKRYEISISAICKSEEFIPRVFICGDLQLTFLRLKHCLGEIHIDNVYFEPSNNAATVDKYGTLSAFPPETVVLSKMLAQLTSRRNIK